MADKSINTKDEIKDIFETRGNSIYCKYETMVYIEESNVTELEDGNLSVMLFGALCVVFPKNVPGGVVKIITLGSKAIIPIYSKDNVQTEDGHVVITFLAGDCFILNRFIPQEIDNVADMFETFTSGHLSKLIPYGLYYDIIKNNIEINLGNGKKKGKIMFPKILLELLIGEMFLDDKGNKIRRSADSSDLGIPASVDDIIMTAGTFNSIIHEDPNKTILVNRVKPKEQQEQESILEGFFRK